MKVLFIVCFTQVLVTYSITVPPSWPQQNARTAFTNHASRTPLQLKTEQTQFRSFYSIHPKSPRRNTQQLHYRSPNNQQIYINHPPPIFKQNKPLSNSHSYQVVHYDSSQNIPIKQKFKSPPIRQHLTEITQPAVSATTKTYTNYNKPDKILLHENVEETNNKEISEHEVPREVPTRPIYPGEGQWSKYGLKHRPYIRPETNQKPSHEEDEKRPEGYDTFEKGEEKFRQAQNKFNHSLKTFPQRHQLKPSQLDNVDTESETLYKKPEIGFVPEKLYTQVRRTESVKHLPKSAIDPDEENAGRLREVVKNSRIHTVYTEEGYEDSAYDHAGHEKNAEDHEGHAQTSKDKSGTTGRSHDRGQYKYSGDGGGRHGNNYVKKQTQNDDKSKHEDFGNSQSFRTRSRMLKNDAETAGTVQNARKINRTSSVLPTKDIKKITMKNDKGEIDMEIHTEVKYTPQKKKHKYIKIVPSAKNQTESNKTATARSLRRTRRYDKESLSKRYIRKHPTYYWKKNKTTIRPAVNNTQRRFEAAFKTHKSSNKSKVEHLEEDEPVENSSKSTIKATTVNTTTKRTTTITKGTTMKTTTTSTTKPSIATSSSTTETSSARSVSTTTIHPDLLNPELTTKVMRPATPKVLPVKIRKFKVKRQKRYTNDFPKLDVDLEEFVDVETLPEPIQKPDLTYVKYPYYKMPITENLHKDSPLRYAEDMKNIPKKIEGHLSFYESREHIACPEIENNINPIPERIEKQTEGEETDQMADIPDLPRLKGLGDKIDCLKVKYFGENPLDSPFFKEETISQPIPLFSINKKPTLSDLVSNTQNNKPSNTQKRELKIKILEPIVVLDEELMDSATMNPIHKNTEAVLKPPYTLIEMTAMNHDKTIKLKPKSIYDQLSILEQDDKKSEKEKNNLHSTEKFIIIYDKQAKILNNSGATNTSTGIKPEITLFPDNSKSITQLTASSTDKPQEPIQTHHIRKRPINNVRKLTIKAIKKPQIKINPKTTTTTILSTTIESKPTTSTSPPVTTEISKTTSSIPEPILMIQSVESAKSSGNIPPFRPPNNWRSANKRLESFYNIFDISRFLPYVPNHKLITELQYKKEINPNEQLTVYSDVFQTINSNKQKSLSDTEPVAVRIPVPQNEQIQVEVQVQESMKMKNITENVPQSSEIIIGMVPPSNSYKTIYSDQDSASSVIQTYFLDIMPSKQTKLFKHTISKRDTSKKEKKSKQEDIDDLMMEESKFTPIYRRLKRDVNIDEDLLMEETENKVVYSAPPQRKPKVYTEIVRQRPARPQESPEEEEEEEEEEDLNPRKRIYELKSNKPTSTTTSLYPEIEEIIEEIITEAPEPTTTPEPKIYPVEANSQNPNIAEYIFFIEKLHKKWAKEDATSTTEATTTTQKLETKNIAAQTVAESVNVEKGEPTYLQIISQLHQIRKEEDAKTTPPPTEPPASEAYQTIPVKNSNPFINLDSESFMSEVNSMKAKLNPDSTAESTNAESSKSRNYTSKFKTTIDTSKYKTIERNPVNVRHNFSSRFNANDQELPLQKEKTTQTPAIIAIIARPKPTAEPKEKVPITDSILEETTNVPEPEEIQTTTIKTRQRGRFRTRQSFSTTSRPVSSTTSTNSATVNSIYRRRRPARITSTTQPTTKTESYLSRRRNRPKATEVQSLTSETPNHKTTFTVFNTETTEPIVVVTPGNQQTGETQEPRKQRRFQKVQERHVMSEVTLTRFFEPNNDEEDSEETKKHQYEVIGPLSNLESGHGGNYKHKNDKKYTDNSKELTTIVETVSPSASFYTDPALAENVNYLKETQGTSTEKPQASNNLLTQEEIAEKVAEKPTYTKVNLFPTMARMINRLADTKSGKENENMDEIEEEIEEEEEEVDKHKPTFIKDPSQRMYYYAKL